MSKWFNSCLFEVSRLMSYMVRNTSAHLYTISDFHMKKEQHYYPTHPLQNQGREFLEQHANELNFLDPAQCPPWFLTEQGQ